MAIPTDQLRPFVFPAADEAFLFAEPFEPTEVAALFVAVFVPDDPLFWLDELFEPLFAAAPEEEALAAPFFLGDPLAPDLLLDPALVDFAPAERLDVFAVFEDEDTDLVPVVLAAEPPDFEEAAGFAVPPLELVADVVVPVLPLCFEDFDPPFDEPDAEPADAFDTRPLLEEAVILDLEPPVVLTTAVAVPTAAPLAAPSAAPWRISPTTSFAFSNIASIPLVFLLLRDALVLELDELSLDVDRFDAISDLLKLISYTKKGCHPTTGQPR